MQTKVCKTCGEEKPVCEFYKKRNGYEGSCKKCKEIKRRNRHKHICVQCGKEFTSPDKNSIYCSNACHGKSRETRITFNCDFCGKESSDKVSHYNKKKNHFCSTKCMHDFQSVNWKGENSPLYKKVKCKCDNCNKEIVVSNYSYTKNKHNFCSVECMGEWRVGKFCGENSPKWNSNLTEEERIKGRNIEGYNDFIKDVYKRDNYTCQCCGIAGNGHNLNAHHIYSYSKYKDLRTDINNGITLCEDCHKEFHKEYGYGDNTKEQFEEWMKNKLNNNA